MAIWNKKNGEKKLFNIFGTDVTLLDLYNNFKDKGLEGAMKELGECVRTYFKSPDLTKDGLYFDDSDELNADEDNNVVQRLEDYFQTKFSNPNLLINGGFLINQRNDGTGYHVIDNNNNGQYTFDRWRLGLGTSDSSYKLEKSDMGIKISQLDGGSSFCDISQICEGVFSEDTILTASFKFKKLDKIGKLAFITDEGTVLNELEFNSTGIYKFTFTQKANKKVAFQLRLHTDGIGELGYLRWCKLEIGNKATPSISRPYGEELALCQRYYEQIYLPNIARMDTGYVIRASYKVFKRTTPTFVYKSIDGTIGKLSYYDTDKWTDIDVLNNDWSNSLGYSFQFPGSGIDRDLFINGVIVADAEIY